jgi:hypothetical protein
VKEKPKGNQWIDCGRMPKFYPLVWTCVPSVKQLQEGGFDGFVKTTRLEDYPTWAPPLPPEGIALLQEDCNEA